VGAADESLAVLSDTDYLKHPEDKKALLKSLQPGWKGKRVIRASSVF
jgi:hypothetical protein